MISSQLADKLVFIAKKQRIAATKARDNRMHKVSAFEDLYFNKILQTDTTNFPFPFFAGHIDSLHSKIDNPPTVEFTIPNKRDVADKVGAAWLKDSSSSRAKWAKKDRLEKKLALLSGRGIANIYATSVKGEYKPHYDVIDYRFFLADSQKSDIDDMMYCGREDIIRTKHNVMEMAKMGVYHSGQVAKLISTLNNESEEYHQESVQGMFNRQKAMGLNPEDDTYAGQSTVNLVEWQMEYHGEKYYLLFDAKLGIWIRAEKLQDVFGHDKYSYVSWATNEIQGNFWSKSPGDDIHPTCEAMRIAVNEAIENNTRINKPEEYIDAGAFEDVSDIYNYEADKKIMIRSGMDVNQAIQTKQYSPVNMDVVAFLDNMIKDKTGVSGAGVADDQKVGIYYGQLEEEADRIGNINKSYSESYADKAYRYYWGLKKHLKTKKAIEMLGTGGYHWEELTSAELADAGDVDDVVTTGGSQEERMTEMRAKRRSESLAAITSAYGEHLSPQATIRMMAENGGFEQEEIDELLDVGGEYDKEQIGKADESIDMIVKGKTPRKYLKAGIQYMERIVDWAGENLHYVKLNAKGDEVGIDERMYETYEKLMAHVDAHMEIVAHNMASMQQNAQMMQGQPMEQPDVGVAKMPAMSKEETQMNAARPFENPMGTPGGTQALSSEVSNTLSP